MGSSGGGSERALQKLVGVNASIMKSNQEEIRKILEDNKIMNEHWRKSYEILTSKYSSNFDKKITEVDELSEQMGKPPSNTNNEKDTVFDFEGFKEERKKRKYQADHSPLFQKI